MHRTRALALLTGVNVDGARLRVPERTGDRWFLDPRLPVSEQTGEAVYRDNPLDRGHLVRRRDPAWGDTDAQAKAANDDTFHYTNAAPQHHLFNAGRTLWVGLEDYVLQNAETQDLQISVFTGPVLAPDDAFWALLLHCLPHIAADPLERMESTPLPRELIRPADLLL